MCFTYMYGTCIALIDKGNNSHREHDTVASINAINYQTFFSQKYLWIIRPVFTFYLHNIVIFGWLLQSLFQNLVFLQAAYACL